MDERKPFRLLSHEEFAALSQEEKIAYLKGAIEAVRAKIPMTGLAYPDADEPDPS
jgi:hypothetical protein